MLNTPRLLRRSVLLMAFATTPLAAQEPDTTDFTSGWTAAVDAVLQRPEWLVPGWSAPFRPSAAVQIRGRLLACLPEYPPVAFPACRDRGPGAPGPEAVPMPAALRHALEAAGLDVCDSLCPVDGSTTILALSQPLLLGPITLQRLPWVTGGLVVEVHVLAPDPAHADSAYGRNVLAVLLKREGAEWSVSGVHATQRQRWPAADVAVGARSMEATVGDTLRIRWHAIDALGREIEFRPMWSARGSVRLVNPIEGILVAREMGQGAAVVEAGSPPDGFSVTVRVNVREPRVDPADRPAVTEALVERERTEIYRAVLTYFCSRDVGEQGVVILDPRIYPHGYHHHRMDDAPRHEEARLTALVESTCADSVHEEGLILHPVYFKVGLSPPVFKDGGEIEVEVIVHGHSGGSWSSNTAFRLARGQEGWRVVLVEMRWIT